MKEMHKNVMRYLPHDERATATVLRSVVASGASRMTPLKVTGTATCERRVQNFQKFSTVISTIISTRYWNMQRTVSLAIYIKEIGVKQDRPNCQRS